MNAYSEIGNYAPADAASFVAKKDQPFQSMFLPGLPHSDELPVSKDKESVGRHELAHALVGIAHGAQPGTLRVISGKEGVTTFPGGLGSRDAASRIAMAGIAETGPEGGDSDKVKAAMLSGWQGVKGKKTEAEGILKHYPDGVRRRGGRIVAHLGEVDGSLVPAIVGRAYEEEAMAKRGRRGGFNPSIVRA